jgi:hypothetical protein
MMYRTNVSLDEIGSCGLAAIKTPNVGGFSDFRADVTHRQFGK